MLPLLCLGKGLGFLQELRQQSLQRARWGRAVWGHTEEPVFCPEGQQVERLLPCEVSFRAAIQDCGPEGTDPREGEIALQGAALLSKSHPGQAQLLWQPCSLLRTPCGLQHREVS